MTFEMFLVASLALSLAWVNGANDISKGVATLVGSGTSRARTAIWWGTLWTVLGGVATVGWGTALLETFASGYLRPGFAISTGFIASALVGAASWVFIATRRGLPVSTTHALLGGVAGAALVLAGPGGLRMAAVANKALLPLLVGPLIAVVLCALFLLLARWVAGKVPAWRPGCCDHADWRRNPFVCAAPGANVPRSPWLMQFWVGLHWLSSGATSFARGLNDTPKIAAFLVLATSLNPGVSAASFGSHGVWSVVAVAVVMGLGCLWGGFRVLDVLSHRITPLDAGSGVVANTGTAMLVLAASPLGLPISTTHVSAGALMGIRWANKARPDEADALKHVLYGWVVTLPAAMLLAAFSASIVSRI